jgi:DNA-binding response OmpR family regulator
MGQLEPFSLKKRIREEEEMFEGKVALIVEDDELLLSSIKYILEACSIKAVTACSLMEAQNKVGKQKFDWILMDYQLKHGVSCQSLIEGVRENCKHMNYKTPIIIVSGTLDADRVQQIKGRVQMILVKPVNKETILSTLTKFI